MPHGSDPISETYKDNGGCEPGDLRITFVSMAFSLPTPSFALKRDESRWDGLPPLVKAETVFELVWAALSALLFLFIVFKLFKIRISSTPRGPYILLALVSFTSAISNARLEDKLLAANNPGHLPQLSLVPGNVWWIGCSQLSHLSTLSLSNVLP
ncbi:hypothetical protein FRC14_001051 [Serendipita sp. 396]|nr:hypothetical protein FRC14_001051 [Serendipita sp. 396]